LQRSLAYLQVPRSPDLPLPPESVIPVLRNFNPKEYDRTPKKVVATAE
jgi:hypothetical protein